MATVAQGKAARADHLRRLIEARGSLIDSKGNALRGFKKNVATLRAELAKLTGGRP
jgi:hypothetical protein